MEKRRHHYRAEFYLKGFANDLNQVQVFDRQNNNSFLTNVSKACVERDFFSFDQDACEDNERFLVEDQLAILECQIAVIVERIRESKTLECAKIEEIKLLLEWAAWMFLVHPLNKKIVNELFQKIYSTSLNLTQTDHLNIFSRGIEKIIPFFMNRYWELGVIEEEDGFLLTSDRSVILAGKTLFEPVGLDDAIFIFFPLSSRLILVGAKESICGYSMISKKISKEFSFLPNMLSVAKAYKYVIAKNQAQLDQFHDLLRERDLSIIPNVTVDEMTRGITIIHR